MVQRKLAGFHPETPDVKLAAELQKWRDTPNSQTMKVKSAVIYTAKKYAEKRGP